MQPMYNWARLENDGGLKDRILSEILDAAMWPTLANTKNSFFAYIYAANVPWADATVALLATQQLAGFPLPPRVEFFVDLRDDPRFMPHEEGCGDQSNRNVAVDVAERPAEEFLWQAPPWSLYDEGDPFQTYPGVDYLVAYWMGRHYHFIEDDTPGKCLVWH